jgi:phosphoribosylanthranilate isomerase
MWIKICGLTTSAALAAALDMQVDAVGFVFADSPRRLSPQQAVELARCVRGRARRVAVTRHPSQPEADEILRVFRPDVLQGDLADLAALRLPASLELLPVVRDGVTAPPALPRRILFEGADSGSGRTSDWRVAAELARRTALVLAGGLTCHNVGAALAAVRPFGVDVSSGVEERPGVKSPAAIEAFIRATRAAAQSLRPQMSEDPP